MEPGSSYPDGRVLSHTAMRAVSIFTPLRNLLDMSIAAWASSLIHPGRTVVFGPHQEFRMQPYVLRRHLGLLQLVW